jgi:hypothetical protein
MDLFRLQVIDFVAGNDGGFSRRGRQPLSSGQRLRRQRRGLGAGGEHCRTRGNSNGDFQKVSAFHDIPSSGWRVMRREFDGGQMNGG